MLREIGGRPIGPDAPVFVIAEIGLNHGGSLPRAIEMVDAAAWAGASAVKLQTIFADRLVAAACPPPAHVAASSLREFFANLQLDVDGHRAVVARARKHGLAVMTTPFTEQALPMLEALNIDAYKVASGDLTHLPLIATLAATGRPLVISTGMGTLADARAAVAAAASAGGTEIAVLHCVSSYPTPRDAQNLRAIATLSRELGVPSGLSDHGADTDAAILAVALGACIYERHLVLDGDTNAIDRDVSSTPAEFRTLIQRMRETQAALGDGRKVCQPAEAPNVVPSRRGLYAARPLRAGDRITPDAVAALRPASALSPAHLELLLGSIVTRDVAAGDPFVAADVAMERAS
jgi:sialic acid synthase SpsE